MKIHFFTFCFLSMAMVAFGQKKQLTIDELVSWKQIKSPVISNDGNWVAYVLQGEKGDPALKLWNAGSDRTYTFDRGDRPAFDNDNQFLVFRISPSEDSVRAMRRRKVDKEKMPKDTLGILRLSDIQLEKVASVKSFSVPEKWGGWIAYHKEAEEPDKDAVKNDTTANPDSTKVEPIEKKKKKAKKESKKTGTKLVIHELQSGFEEVIGFVKTYTLAEEGPRLLLHSTGNDSTMLEGVYLYDCGSRTLKPMFRQKGEYEQMSFDDQGTQLAFLANLDTTKALTPSFGLCYWKDGLDSARIIADSLSSFLPEDWLISENANPAFSKDGSKLYFGIAPPPILQDTSLLDDEIVNVEVWSYTEGRLYTQQKVQLNEDKKRSYRVVWHTTQNRFVPLASETFPETILGDEGNAKNVLSYSEDEYLQLISWEGTARKDVYLVDTYTGVRKEIIKGLKGNPSFSPAAHFIYWYNAVDSLWSFYQVTTGNIFSLPSDPDRPFYEEENDVPNEPWPYGISTWTKDDHQVLIYDRYDIWQVDPTGKTRPVNLTKGRDSRTTYRYIRLDPEERFVTPGQRLMLHIFDEKSKESGYGFLLLGAGQPIQLVKENYAYDRRPQKARDADKIIFTKENFQTFPDLLYSNLSFQQPKQVSMANPQQDEYRWGTIELYEWTALDGRRLQGLLVKPEGFDPSKQYPMIVNFYEKSSDGLNQHRAPYPGRSTINYAYYASRGYLIFNPDVPYRIGYPGESCLNAVIPGITSLIDRGFVDKTQIGVQGHSWGGYQVAYLLTKTDLFKCAESGAPVVNMFSAYGGIRWGSGMSRMFQYERTQSRIGGTIWEYPLRYLENSPLFFMDKVNTPVLILHNDNDSAVPWYQGIEYFTALRRLGKPAWMLNYNDEPHWPVKLQNRIDFQTRMSQYFDYYLKDQPMPQWMERGVPAIEKGILQGLGE